MAVIYKVRDLTPDEADHFSRMKLAITVKSRRNKLRSAYVEAKKRLDKIGFAVPENMIDFQTPLSWPAKACAVPAKRIRPDGYTFKTKSSLQEDVESVLSDDYVVLLERMALASALEHSVSFVFVTPGDVAKGEPRAVLSARTAMEATAEINPRTGRVSAGLETVEVGRKFLMYVPFSTVVIELRGDRWKVTKEYENRHGRVACTPYVWDRSLKRPFGHSRVTRPLMGFTDSGVRTMLRQESHAEFFSRPQRALLGAAEIHFKNPDGSDISPLDILTGAVWGLADVLDEDSGELKRPDLKQLSQASMQPHTEMMRGLAMQVSTATAIPIAYLGIVSDNPSSADAIRAAESEMLAMIEAEFPSIALSRTELARNVVAVIHDAWTPEMEKDLAGMKARFLDPGTPTIAARADAGVKFAQTFPDADPEVAMEMYGMNESQIDRMLAYKKNLAGTQKLQSLIAAAASRKVDGPGVPVNVDG